MNLLLVVFFLGVVSGFRLGRRQRPPRPTERERLAAGRAREWAGAAEVAAAARLAVERETSAAAASRLAVEQERTAQVIATIKARVEVTQEWGKSERRDARAAEARKRAYERSPAGRYLAARREGERAAREAGPF